MDAELVGWSTYVDLYCERLGPGLWGEPLNTASNIGFLLAAWGIWRLVPRRVVGPAGSAGRAPGSRRALRVLFALALAVGVGSTLFHVTAQVWSRAVDNGLIVAFELAFLWCYLRAAMRLSRPVAGTAIGVFALAVGYSLQMHDLPGGSVPYFPALAAIVGLGVFHRVRTGAANGPAARGRNDLLAAATVFAVALALRTVDNAICPAWPAGTHFVWHLLNGIVMYLSVRALADVDLRAR